MQAIRGPASTHHLWQAVERLAPLTGRNPVPEHKRGQFRFEPDKFRSAGLTAQRSELVRPPRVRECLLQFEAAIVDLRPIGDGSAFAIEAAVQRVHAAPQILVGDTNHIDPQAWRPLLYTFRHYFSQGAQLGKTFRAET